jgi:hypothetical protein
MSGRASLALILGGGLAGWLVLAAIIAALV